MKRIFVFIFGVVFFSFSFRASAQLFDDLFEEEDFQSSEIEEMQKQEAERKKEEAAVQKNAPAPVKQNPPAVQVSQPAPAAVPAVAVPVSQPAAPANAPALNAQAQPKPAQLPPASDGAPAASPPARQRTFSLSVSRPREIQTLSLPQLGSGKAPPLLPDLGSKASEKEENLSLFEMRAKRTEASDTNVLDFDIAGIRLKMTPEEVMEKALAAGFSVKFQDRKIPTLNEWKYRRLCMEQMLFKYDERKRCIQEIARYNNSEYTSRLVFENKPLRETLTVEFASRFAQNQAYRIRYVSKGDHSLGSTDEAHYFKTKRRQEFLRLLITKYDVPDDEQAMLWGVPGVTATLQADLSPSFLDASLVLEDLSIETEDFDNMSIEDAKMPSIEKFSF